MNVKYSINSNKWSISTIFLIIFLSLLALLASCSTTEPQPLASRSPDQQLEKTQGSVNIEEKMIPAVTGQLPIFKLTDNPAPITYLNKLLKLSVPSATNLAYRQIVTPKAPVAASPMTLPNIQKDLLISVSKQRVLAYANKRTGDLELAPLLSGIKPTVVTKTTALSLAKSIFLREDILPRDDTSFSIEKVIPLYGTKQYSGRGKNIQIPFKKSTYLMTVPVQRYYQDKENRKYPIFGPGSRASVTIGDKGIAKGLVRRWKLAHIDSYVAESRSTKDIMAAIKAQLAPATKNADVTVKEVTLGYYDGHKVFMQPVYRFFATIHKKNTVDTALDGHVIGYIPISALREEIPVLNKTPDVVPTKAIRQSGLGVPGNVSNPLDPTVGRYVIQNDIPDWVNYANNFLSGLSAPWPFGSPFTDSQYFWAEPWLYTTDANSFVNSVNIALTLGHMNWWHFQTNRQPDTRVDIPALPQGYGAASGGNLSYWILHGCEPIPSPDDTPFPNCENRGWPDIWWNVFQGLHSVVGLRTLGLFGDEVEYPFGQAISVGIPVVSAWLDKVIHSSAYSAYTANQPMDFNRCGISKPMGRPATISVCGHEDDPVYNTTPLPAADCLIMFWYPD